MFTIIPCVNVFHFKQIPLNCTLVLVPKKLNADKRLLLDVLIISLDNP